MTKPLKAANDNGTTAWVLYNSYVMKMLYMLGWDYEMALRSSFPFDAEGNIWVKMTKRKPWQPGPSS